MMSQDTPIETKECEQCHQKKALTEFHRRKNKTDGRMRICAQCYGENLTETRRRGSERMRQWEMERQQQQQRKREEQEERKREWASAVLLLAKQACAVCNQEFTINKYGYLSVPFFDMHSSTCEKCGEPLEIEYREDGSLFFGCQGHVGGGASSALYGCSPKYCPTCHEDRRKVNRQAYPLCQMCNTPTRVHDFLREYQGYGLDIIKVCCKNCIPQFESLSEPEQLELLRCAMVKTYGETAVIYALQYDDHFPCQHIGRTKHYARRMAEYRRNWHIEIKHHFILEEVPFGPLSMERESRWMLHALKHRWPIDNFELLKIGEDGLGGRRLQAQLVEAVQPFEPLTAPFETIAPLLRKFLNTHDAHIAHWFVERQQAML